MQRRIFLGTCLSLLTAGGLTHGAEKAQPVPYVSIVLDCSLSMGGAFPIATEDTTEELSVSSTKLVEAKAALKELLDELAINGQTKVGMWLYGHRLQWEADVAEPRMIEQQKYFEHALGFEVLETLLPGDDVQALRGISVLEPKHLPALNATLDVVEPWGEDPLYLALRQTIESQPREGSAATRRLVLVTDGGNQQGMARFRSTKDQVIDALRKNEISVQIVYLGSAQDLPRQTASDFLQITRASQGKIHTAKTLDELHAALHNAVLPKQAQERHAPTRLETVSTPVSPAPLLKPVTVQGKVSYYRMAVKGAEITLIGENLRRTVKTDGDGFFQFDEVPSGAYSLTTAKTIKNKIRDNERKVTVPLTSEHPIDLSIVLE